MDPVLAQLDSYRRAYMEGAITLHEYMLAVVLAVVRVAVEWVEANPTE
jgi:uncharacterized membrane protein